MKIYFLVMEEGVILEHCLTAKSFKCLPFVSQFIFQSKQKQITIKEIALFQAQLLLRTRT